MAKFRRRFGLTFLICIVMIKTSTCEENSLSQTKPDTIFPAKRGKVVLYTLDNKGVFHRCVPFENALFGDVTYSVLKNGILVPRKGPYPIQYKISKRGDLVPKKSNTCIYKSDKESFYLLGKRKILIPVEVLYSDDRIYYVYGKKQLYSEPLQVSSMNPAGFRERQLSLHLKRDKDFIIPDRTCNGDITLFLLNSTGYFERNPPDEYIPNGIKFKYHLRQDGSLKPIYSKIQDPPQLTYLTENGNLRPCPLNSHILTTVKDTRKSFILAEGGVLAPVSESIGINKTINYFFDGRLIHSSKQFRQLQSNASTVVLSERVRDTDDTEIDPIKPGPKFECDSRRRRRDAKYEDEEGEPCRKPHGQNAFVYDDRGKRLRLQLYVNEKGGIAMYKMTCKGKLQRLDPREEPEYKFIVQFKVLDSLILVPTATDTGKVCLKYTLQKDGSLKPIKNQEFTLKKAPASVLYYGLTVDKALLPIRVNILKSDHLEVYYQDLLIHTVPPNRRREMECVTTLFSPLFAYLNGRVTIIYHDIPPKRELGATWRNIGKSGGISYPNQNIYLKGPDGKKIKIEVELNHNRVPVIYEMDWNGLCHRSPKEDKKNMVLRSYKLLPEGILLPTNDTDCYIYLVDKQGNMLPYCYPESKLRAPDYLTVKYVTCKGGILLPVLVEAQSDHIRFSFENIVVYYKTAYTLEEIVEISKNHIGKKEKIITETDDKNVTCPFYPELANSDPEPIIQDTSEYHKENGSCVCFRRTGNVFRRCPQRKVEDYLVNHEGYLSLKDGILEPFSYSDPNNRKEMKIQITSTGDLKIVEDYPEKIASDYLLARNGSLIPVEVHKNDGVIECYRDGLKITEIKENCGQSTNETDPLGLLNDPEPDKSHEDEPHQLTIPIEETPKKIKKPADEDIVDQEKCEQMREAIRDYMKKDPGLADVELEMSDSCMKEIYKLVCQCSKGKNSKKAKKRIRRNIRRMVKKIRNSSEENITC